MGANVGLERGKVVSAALRLLDEVGLDGLTTRRLAEDLGVRGPALYWHFENKQALTDAMAYALLADAIDDAPVVGDWVALMTGEARRIRRTLLSHRDGARLLAGYRPKEPLGRFVNDLDGQPAGADTAEAQANAHLAQLLRALIDAGFNRAEAMSAFMTVLLFTFGWTMDEQAGRGRQGGPTAGFDREQGFEFGLATVLAGLQARAGRTAPRA